MASILILSLVFPPDSVSTAQIIGDLAEDLTALGNSVTVLTTSPHYNRDLEAESRQPIHNYLGRILRKSDYHGVPVYHTIMPRKGTNLPLRLLSWTGFHVISTIAGMSLVPKPDVVLAPSPPLTIGLCAMWLARFYGIYYIYNVQEIYPDVAVNLGAISNKWMIRLLLNLERFVYKKARAITVIAPRMRQRLLEKGVPDERIRVIPNFVDVDDLHPLSKDNAFSRQHHVHEKFLVSYSGNMGPAQGLESFIEAANLLQAEPNIHFMMMGSGILKEKFWQRVVKLALTNLTFLPYQHYSLMAQIYAASDLCLVSQTAGTGSDAVPSKVYRIMAAARPVLACTDLKSDLADLITGADCGVVVQPGSAQSLAEAIQSAYQNRDIGEQMGQAGRNHVVKHYARSVIINRYNELIQTLTNGSARKAASAS
jgi:colanic acid biosynthesis glycosyl transferase WcaI